MRELSSVRSEVWYLKSHKEDEPEFERERDIIMGHEFAKKSGSVPDPDNLQETHILLNVDSSSLAADPEWLFSHYQGENWSPNGEARPLISFLGLKHTSMSVGDVVVLVSGEKRTTIMVDRLGFVDLSTGEAYRRDEPEQDSGLSR